MRVMTTENVDENNDDKRLNKNVCSVQSIVLQLHGLCSGTSGSVMSSMTTTGRTTAPTTAMAFFPGDIVNGSVKINVISSNNNKPPADAPPSSEEGKPKNQPFAGFDSIMNNNNNNNVENNSAAANSNDSKSADDCNIDDFITVTLHGYGKMRIVGRLFRKQDIFVNEQKKIPILHDLTPEGHNLFLFDFKLPDNLPPSFDGVNAKICYRISAKYRTGAEVRLPIEIRYNGRQSDEKLHTGADDDFDRRNMDVCCFSCGTRSVYAKIERSIFLHQGDVILVHARFHNLRGHAAKPFVRLVQRQSARFQWRSLMTIRKTLHEWPLSSDADSQPLSPYKDRNWTNARCSTPAVIPSFTSSFLKVDYFLEIGLFERGSIYKNPVVTLAITMATNSVTAPLLDRTHLYVSGRKHGGGGGHRATSGPPDSFRTGITNSMVSNLSGNKVSDTLLVNSSSQNSYLSAIAEAQEGESSCCEEEEEEEKYDDE